MKLKSTLGKVCFNFKNKNSSLLYVLSCMLNADLLLDRFGFLSNNTEWNTYSTTTNIDEILETPYVSFYDSCIEKTNYFNAMNKPMFLLLSGGIDSTTMLASFLLNPETDRSKIYCLYNDLTVENYPNLINLINKENLQSIKTKINTQELFSYSNEGICITGLGADEIEGKNNYKNLKSDFFNDFKKMLLFFNFGTERYDEYKEQLETFFSYCNFTNVIESIKYFSLIRFNLLYYHNLELSKTASVIPENTYMFFDSIRFQNYFFSTIKTKNQEEIITYTGLKYKPNFKKIIYKWNKDRDFLYSGKTQNFGFGKYAGNEFIINGDEEIKKFVIPEDNNLNEIKEYMLTNYIKPEHADNFIIDIKEFAKKK